MKYCYFLQTLKDVPLGYHFSLYSYGPFDSAVLADLGEAEAQGFVDEAPIPAGYGYRIKSSRSGEDLTQESRFISEYKADVDWVVDEFGAESTSDLELDSTIVYVDREAADAARVLSIEALTRQVGEVKPRFSESTIRMHVEALQNKDFLRALKT